MADLCLKCDYPQVETLVGDMRNYKDEIDSIYDEMYTTVESLVNNGYMQAETATGYVQEFKTILGPNVQDFSELMSDFYTQLTQVCERLAAKDKSMNVNNN